MRNVNLNCGIDKHLNFNRIMGTSISPNWCLNFLTINQPFICKLFQMLTISVKCKNAKFPYWKHSDNWKSNCILVLKSRIMNIYHICIWRPKSATVLQNGQTKNIRELFALTCLYTTKIALRLKTTQHHAICIRTWMG